MAEVTSWFRLFDPINKADAEEEIIDFIRKNHLNVAPFAMLHCNFSHTPSLSFKLSFYFLFSVSYFYLYIRAENQINLIDCLFWKSTSQKWVKSTRVQKYIFANGLCRTQVQNHCNGTHLKLFMGHTSQ